MSFPFPSFLTKENLPVRARFRQTLVTEPHTLRASQKRSYAAFVRNTSRRPSALDMSWWGMGLMVVPTWSGCSSNSAVTRAAQAVCVCWFVGLS